MDEFVAVFRAAPRIPRLFMAAFFVVSLASAWWWIRPIFSKERGAARFGLLSILSLAAFVLMFAYFSAQVPVSG
ncbi:hypothetical protein LDO32_03820 [Luteimonas sp. Y-2-2-4F]|nr:hypothetical protein [Luteimonas sp. Y-2-2-4F]MCD9030862.1 hypothetical protein [Luteimonas sp. Y-2-2-4F]